MAYSRHGRAVFRLEVTGHAGASGADRMNLQAPRRSRRRWLLTRDFLRVVARLYSRVRVDGLEKLPAGPSILCFSHQNWADPFYVCAAVPERPRVYFFGPEQEDMRHGFRNRVMRWSGTVVPFQPGKRGLVAATRLAEALVGSGSTIAIAGEGRIHSGESELLPLLDGPAYLAVRSGVPIIPVAINGTGWLGFRRLVRVTFGAPIAPSDVAAAATREAVDETTARTWLALHALLAGFPDRPAPHFVGRRLTELFNDWPEGTRPPVPLRKD
ncbi:MAG TPA: lysophospholipid acyltransferase family protein [Candidatus Limnocylindrales bacterium]